MNRINFFRILTISSSVLALAACGQVAPGHVGIKVEQYGSNSGVSDQPLGVGTYFTPVGTTIYEYPIFSNTYTFTQSTNEGKAVNEEFSFQDKNGLSLSSDVAVTYSINPQLAPKLFSKYRTDTTGLIDGPIRNAIRNALSNRAAAMSVDEIYGPRKQELLAQVQSDVTAYFSPYGLNIEKLFWAGNIRVPEVVQTQINNKLANEQEALAAMAKVKTVEAEASQKVAAAEGESKSIQITGDALRANPQVLQLKSIEKWNGQLPQVTSGATPFVNLK